MYIKRQPFAKCLALFCFCFYCAVNYFRDTKISGVYIYIYHVSIPYFKTYPVYSILTPFSS